MRSVPTALSIILALFSAILGWQLYSTRLALDNQASFLAHKNVQLAEVTQKLSQRERELDQQRQALEEERVQHEAANGKASAIKMQRTWHVRSLQNILMNSFAFRTEPSEDKIRVNVAVALRYPAFGAPRTVRVQTSALGWGAQDNVMSTPEGMLVLSYEVPTAVKDATITISP